MAIAYRADIDGLRAIAVVAVVLFHLGLESFSGGYVGVDIFFVISGYLITSIILRELQENRFSIARFYERRCRRILPALTAVVLACALAGVVLFDATRLQNLGETTLATALFSSNFNFFLDTGYFAAPSEAKPLLHTWSLAVEEQYYIFFPLLMIGIAKFAGGKYARWLFALGGISLALSVMYVMRRPAATFFLIPFRTWELMIGSLLAVGVVKPMTSQSGRDILSVVGLIAMLASITLFTDETPFPGYAALLPTVGSAAIIYAGIGGKSVVGRAISIRPIVFVGLISYSFYLWHWPAILFVKYYNVVALSVWQTTALLVIVFAFSALSWKYIEGPFRNKQFVKTRRQVFTLSVVASLAMIAIGGLFVIQKGLPGRYSFDDPITLAVEDPLWDKWIDCEREIRSGDLDLCNIGKEGETQDVLLWGDSHARGIAAAVHQSALDNSKSGAIATRSACLPLLGIDREGRTSCAEFNEQILRYVQDRPGIHTVILAGRWALSANGTRLHLEEGSTVRLVDTGTADAHLTNVDLISIGMDRTVRGLQNLGRRVVIVEQVPEIGYEVPAALFATLLSGRDVADLIAPSIEEYQERNMESSSVIDSLRQVHDFDVVHPASLLCGSVCDVATGNTPIYRDNNHLSIPGARKLSTLFDPVFVSELD